MKPRLSWGKEDTCAKGQGQRDPEWGRPWWGLKMLSGSVLGTETQCHRCCHHSVCIYLDSSASGLLSLPVAVAASLLEGCLQAARIHFACKSQELQVLEIEFSGAALYQYWWKQGYQFPSSLTPMGVPPRPPLQKWAKVVQIGTLLDFSPSLGFLLFLSHSVTPLLAFPGTLSNKWLSQEFLSLEMILRYPSLGSLWHWSKVNEGGMR